MNIFSYYKLSNEEMKQFNEPKESSNYEADEYILEFLKELRTINRTRMMEKQLEKFQHQQERQHHLEQHQVKHQLRQHKQREQSDFKMAPREYQKQKYDKFVEHIDQPKAKTPTFDISEIERKIDTMINEQNTTGFKINNQADKGISFRNYHESNKLMIGANSTENNKSRKRDFVVKGLKKVLHIKKR